LCPWSAAVTASVLSAINRLNERVDLLARVWQSRAARAGMFAVLEDGAQYRVALAQQLWDDDGLRVTDLTLERIDALYDVAGTAENDR